jgi:hypothetical protein
MTMKGKRVNDKIKVAFDIDDTLVKYTAGHEVPRPNRKLLEVLIFFHAIGAEVIVWSGGGESYARLWATRLFIDHLVTIRAKPLLAIGKRGEEIGPGEPVVDIAFDDMEVSYGKVNIRV